MDPPEDALLEFADHEFPKPVRFASEDRVVPEKERYMIAPPIEQMRNQLELKFAVYGYWLDTMQILQEEHLKPLGLDVWDMLEEVQDNHPELMEKYRQKLSENPPRYYIAVEEDTTEEDARRAHRLIKDALDGSSRKRAPSRDPLVAVQCALLYDRYNAVGPTDKRRRKWTYARLAEEFGLKSVRAAKEYVAVGRQMLKLKV
jgi:hypothetical protein